MQYFAVWTFFFKKYCVILPRNPISATHSRKGDKSTDFNTITDLQLM